MGKSAGDEDREFEYEPGKDDQEEYVQRNFWQKAKRTAAKVPFVLDAVALYFCARDPEVPLNAKLIALGALAYFIWPADAIPDWILVAGYIDDAGAVAAAIAAIGVNITEEHRRKASEWLRGEGLDTAMAEPPSEA